MEPPPLEILLEDGPVLAVNKPAGLLTQGVPAALPTLEGQVRAYIKQKYAKPGNVYLGIPHRLDRPTSGVIVFARNSKAAARLAEQFHDRRVRKEYLAIVEGVPAESEGTLTDWLLKDAARSHVKCVAPHTPGSKEASLRYRVLTAGDGIALLHLEPRTGRMHQIRVQLAARGWPVLGDVQYGAKHDDRGGNHDDPAALLENRRPNGPQSIALHARRLTILHPVRYDPLQITAPVPVSWEVLGLAGTGDV